MQRQLAASMIVVCNHHSGYFVDSPEPPPACSCCSGYGDDRAVNRGLCDRTDFLCVLCELHACEDCVVLATFGGNSLHPTSWICCGCRAGFDTVPTLRSWLFDVVGARMLRVYLEEYQFYLWVQFVTLSGEVLRDVFCSEVLVMKFLWGATLDLAWIIVDHASGGRLREMVFGTVVVNATNKSRLLWSDLVSRFVARAHDRTSPLQVTVLLDGY